ncbi:integral membrane protein MviN, partial [Vibrio parahaemolyticus V-223/04]
QVSIKSLSVPSSLLYVWLLLALRWSLRSYGNWKICRFG